MCIQMCMMCLCINVCECACISIYVVYIYIAYECTYVHAWYLWYACVVYVDIHIGHLHECTCGMYVHACVPGWVCACGYACV